MPTQTHDRLVTLTIAERFMRAFEGASSLSYLECKGDAIKHLAGSLSVRDYEEHLTGRVHMGLIPSNEIRTCRWGAIDIDFDPDKDPPIDHAKLQQECKDRRMALIVVRSRHDGAHLYLFFQDPQPPHLVRKKLREYAAALGYPHAEINPKQDKASLKNKGNGIRLPYAGKNSLQYAVSSTGSALSVEEFLTKVEELRVTDLSQLDDVDLKPPAKPSVQAPAKAPAPEYRNNRLFKEWIRRRRFGDPPEVCDAVIRALNQLWFAKHSYGPLPERELETTIFKSGRAEKYAPKERRPLRLLTSAELTNLKETDDGDWLVKKLIPRLGYVLTAGRPKSGKSLKGQQLCFEAAIGRPVFGSFNVTRAVRCCYVDFAQSAAETQRRHLQMVKAYPGETQADENLFFMTKNELHYAEALAREISDIGNPRSLEFSELLVSQKIELLVLAEVRSLVKFGGNLKDADVAELINQWVEWLQKQTGITTDVIHHARKGDQVGEAESFGSTMLTAAPDAILSLKRLPSGLRQVHVEARFDAPNDFFLQLQQVNGGQLLRAVEDPNRALNDRIWQLHQDGRSSRKIAEAIGHRLSHNAIQARINDREAEEEAKGQSPPGEEGEM